MLNFYFIDDFVVLFVKIKSYATCARKLWRFWLEKIFCQY